MTNKRDDVSLSRLELVLLARYAGSKIPDEETLNQEVLELVFGGDPPRDAKEKVNRARANLRARALIEPKAAKRGAQPSALRLTVTGEQTLRTAFSIPAHQAPSWAKVRDACMPALGLGLRPGSAEAATAQRTLATLMIEMLHVEHGTPRGPTVNVVCDLLLTEALGLPAGPITSLESLRAQFLARRLGETYTEGTPLMLAKRAVAPQIEEGLTKTELNKMLGRRWVSAQTDHGVLGASSSPSPSSSSVSAAASQAQPPSAAKPPQPPSHSPPTNHSPPTAEAMLKAVREALPLVGSDGRYGSEKVFVSALWRNLQETRRLNGGYSIESFKQWLLKANRQGELVLARADLIGAMDQKLVADSEIREHGATFHFVLDRRPSVQPADRRSHAR